MERVVCIIQARMGSSRLPGKVLKDIGGKPMLGWVVERVRQCKKVDQVVVATTGDTWDEPICEYCRAESIACFRGNLFDVLDRYYQAAIGLDVEVVSMAALSEAWENAKEQHEREHVMPYLYAGPRQFKTSVIDAPQDYGSQRWTVDTPEDLEFLRGIARLLNGRMDFTWMEILTLVQAHPELSLINATVQHKFMKDVDDRASKK
jgi:spore coat polysaccharide biosynthesis protein SpsF